MKSCKPLDLLILRNMIKMDTPYIGSKKRHMILWKIKNDLCQSIPTSLNKIAELSDTFPIKIRVGGDMITSGYKDVS